MMGVGVGLTLMPIVAGKLVAILVWRQAYACIGGACILVGLAAHQLIFKNLTVNYETAGKSGEAIDSNEGTTFSQAVKGYRFWLIGVVAVVVGATTAGALVHLNAYATDRGVSPLLAAQSVGFLGLGVIASRLATGLILDRVFAPLVGCVALLVTSAGFYLLIADNVQLGRNLSLAAILIGIAGGTEGDLVPFLAKRYFGVRSIGAIYGALMGMFSMGGALGAYVYGLAFDQLRSYVPVVQASTILCCICSVSIMLLGPYQFSPLGGRR